MSRQRCRAPGCGRFIATGTEFCPGHTGTDLPDEGVLQDEIRALRQVLARLLELDNLDMQARYIPRITSVSIQAARARHQLGASDRKELLDMLGPVSEELDERIAR